MPETGCGAFNVRFALEIRISPVECAHTRYPRVTTALKYHDTFGTPLYLSRSHLQRLTFETNHLRGLCRSDATLRNRQCLHLSSP